MVCAMNYLDGLNPPQRDAIEHTEGPLLVLAGAGTGKTRVLTTRLAHILLQGKAQPQEILAVTFTNKAAKEMGERVEQLIGTSSSGIWLGTFHSLCARLLRRHAEGVGLESDFTILDTDDQQRLIKEILEDRSVDTTRWPPRMMISIISRWKDNGWVPDDVPAEEATAINGKMVDIYKEYQRRLKALNACDFGDLLLHVVTIFKRNPDVLNMYQEQFKYVLVDEYQDTNGIQYLWLRLLTQLHKNVCVVGDDDQSIYGWRGAQVGNILRFEKDYPGSHVVRLEQNYRSTGHILKAASHLIGHNEERHTKTLWTEGGEGEKIELHPVQDEREESRLVSDSIERHQRDGGRYTDCAVLVRTAAQTRAFEERFMQAGLPYVIVGGLRFYDRKEIKDAVAYLRLVHSNKDNLAFLRVVNVPRRGVGDTSLREVQEVARDRGMTLFDAARIAAQEGRIKGRAATQLAAFTDQIDTLRNLGQGMSPDRLLEQLLEDSGYADMLRKDKDPDAKTRLENLKELVRALQEYENLTSFLEHVALVNEETETLEDSVRVTTVHAAKGLEFDTVFIPGFEDGLFPHQRALNEDGAKGVEEERRLAYVAITRAKRRLIMSYTHSRRMYGQWQPSAASRFLEELPGESIDVKQSTMNTSSYGSGYGGGRHRHGSTVDRRSATDFSAHRAAFVKVKDVPTFNPNNDAKTEDGHGPGQRIFHQKFGYGRIRNLEGAGPQQKVVIDFEKAGQKKLLASLAKLERA